MEAYLLGFLGVGLGGLGGCVALGRTLGRGVGVIALVSRWRRRALVMVALISRGRGRGVVAVINSAVLLVGLLLVHIH